ncbi:hypothetical protein EDS67_22405 [candidate division KSB1 bacterium]|nr:MAG: hypothetical protein EDS67_22405 [candidate division KSB1 bacterium]MBC6951389.1 hypothetical protein [candidate division KSB1 bacterium]MCE7943734.1 hypothetical protein [Chlorobi bacterium CHB1]
MHNFKTFTGEENHAITTSEALTFIKQFREHYGPEAAPGVFFNKQAVRGSEESSSTCHSEESCEVLGDLPATSQDPGWMTRQDTHTIQRNNPTDFSLLQAPHSPS